MHNHKISNRYAKALFNTAEGAKNSESVLNDSLLILDTLNENKELLRALKNPTINKLAKINLVKKLFNNRINKTTMDFLSLLVHKGREVLLSSIIEDYISFYNKSKNIIVAQVVSSKPLDLETKEIIKSKINPNSTVKLEETVDPSLVGGFIIKHGDLQYDASIKKQIKNVKRAFKL
jgi:F-type H+-transporting ATPase subunit delta